MGIDRQPLADKLEITLTQLDRLHCSRSTTEKSDGTFVDTEEEPSFERMFSIKRNLEKKHSLRTDIELGAALHAAGVITKEEGEWLDELYLDGLRGVASRN